MVKRKPLRRATPKSNPKRGGHGRPLKADMSKVFVKTLPEHQGLPLPEPATAHSAGVDLRAAIAATIVIKPGERMLISAGIKVAVPQGFEWQIRPRSGLALKHGVTVLNSPGTIDSDYRGPVGVILINHGTEDFSVARGDRIAQAVLARVEPVVLESVNSLDETERGEGGFGHTGV